MIKDLPYSALTQDKRAYEIMLLRDQSGKTFAEIANEYGRSASSAVQIYNRIKLKQLRLYRNHITILLGPENALQTQKSIAAAYAWYQALSDTCAYLEKEYDDILTPYRGGEPGMPPQLLEQLPPFQPKLREETIARVVTMREGEKATFPAIAQALGMTQAKARHAYEQFYHEQVLERIDALRAQAKSEEEKAAIWDTYFRGYKSAKKRYDMLVKEACPNAPSSQPKSLPPDA